jgi:hypothetical protein
VIEAVRQLVLKNVPAKALRHGWFNRFIRAHGGTHYTGTDDHSLVDATVSLVLRAGLCKARVLSTLRMGLLSYLHRHVFANCVTVQGDVRDNDPLDDRNLFVEELVGHFPYQCRNLIRAKRKRAERIAAEDYVGPISGYLGHRVRTLAAPTATRAVCLCPSSHPAATDFGRAEHLTTRADVCRIVVRFGGSEVPTRRTDS